MSIDDALAQVDWSNTFRRLTLYAKRRLGRGHTIEEAEDIAAEAVRQLFDPTYRGWDPIRETVLWHLQSTVNGLVSNRRRTKVRSEEQLHDFSARPDIGAQTPGAEPALPVQQTLGELQAYAREQGDAIAEAVVQAALGGIVTPKEVALSLGVSPQKIYDARQRLKRYAIAMRHGGEQ